MGKQALAVEKTEVLKQLGNISLEQGNVIMFKRHSSSSTSLFDLSSALYSRNDPTQHDCEKDESLLQVLPYISLVNKTTGEVFAYQRGNGGTEARLHGDYSIGLGGHIEEQPDNTDCDLMAVVAVNAMRELNEEVGMEFTAKLLGRIYNKLADDDYALFYVNTRPVDRVHLCLWIRLEIDPTEIKQLEGNVIDKGQWIAPEQLDKLAELGQLQLEEWTRVGVNILVGKFPDPRRHDLSNYPGYTSAVVAAASALVASGQDTLVGTEFSPEEITSDVANTMATLASETVDCDPSGGANTCFEQLVAEGSESN